MNTILSALLVAQTDLGGDPNPNGLPGSRALQSLVGGVAFWALLAALAGLIVSAAVWALSSHAGNYHHAGMGKRGTLRASTLRARPLEEKAATARAMEREVLPLFAAGRLSVPIAATFGLDEAEDAYARFAAGGKLGKIVLAL